MYRPLLSLWSFWWRGIFFLVVYVIGLPCFLCLIIDPPELFFVLGTIFVFDFVLLFWRPKRIWRFCLQVRRFQTRLGARIVLHFPAHLERKESLQWLLQQCESARDELEDWFGFRLRRRVAVFLVDDKNCIREVLGRTAGGFAMVAGNTIVMAADVNMEELIRHELVHLFAARWGRIARPLFNEGIAVWLQRTSSGVPIDGAALSLLRVRNLQLSALLSRKYFFADATRDACYVLAGSFTGFLIRRHGVATYREFFCKADALNFQSYFRKVFHVSFAKAEWQWRTELQAMAVLRRRLQTNC